MSRVLVDLPYPADTNKYPKFFPHPLLLMKVKRGGDELLDYNLRCRGLCESYVKEKLNKLAVSLETDKREVVVGCGHFPADADKYVWFDYFLRKLQRPVLVTGVYPAVMPGRVGRLHPRHSILPTEWDISDVDIPVEMLEEYPRVGKKLRASVRATRGCPRKCGMCPVWIIHQRKFEFWPVVRTIDRIKRYYDAGVRYITFIDDNLTVSPKFDVLLERLSELKLRGMDYVCQEGFEVASFHRERMCQLLKQVRFVDMKMAIENVNEDVLRRIDKYYKDFSVVERALANIEKYGLGVGSYFLFGLERSEEDVLKNIRFIAERVLDVRVNVVRPYEGGVVHGENVDQKSYKSYASLAYAASWYARVLGVNIMSSGAIDQLQAAGYEISMRGNGANLLGKTDYWRMTSRFVRGLKWMFSQALGGDCVVKVEKGGAVVAKRSGGFGF